MPRKHVKKSHHEGVRTPAQAPADNHVQPDIKRTSPSLTNFQLFSRVHRADLTAQLENTSDHLTAAFCRSWAMSRSVNPAFVVDWVRRRRAGESQSRRTSGLQPPSQGVTDAGGVDSVSSAQTETDNISVKRERAASPVLSILEPAKKKVKACHPPEVRTQQCSSSGTSIDTPRKAIRHTRAHDKSPHPACSTCLQSGGFTMHAIFGSILAAGSEATESAGSSGLQLHGLHSTTPSSAVRPSLKSAFRAPSPSEYPVTRAPRRVHFSQELYLEALTAYNQRPAVPDANTADLVQNATALDNEEVSSPVSDSVDSSRVPLATIVSPSAASALPGPGCLEPLRRSADCSANISRAPISAPRTPSPPPLRKPQDRSFFSPSFFSPAGSPLSSGEDEVEALLASSPPTSPAPIPFSVASPSPKRSAQSSLVNALERCASQELSLVVGGPPPSALVLPPPADIPPRVRTPPNSGPGPGSKPCTPQPQRPPRPTTQAQASPAPAPADIPPRARTPPQGSTPRSLQHTPEPARPARPSVDVELLTCPAISVPGSGVDVCAISGSGVHAAPPGISSKLSTSDSRQPVQTAATPSSAPVNSSLEDRIGAVDTQARSGVQVDAGNVDMPDAHFIVKVEDGDFERPATGRVGEVLVLDDDEEDEPLAIVVARRKAVCVVKSEPVETKLKSSKPATKRAKQSSAVKTKRQVASTTVKTEEYGSPTTSGPVAAPPKKKRPTRAKGAKKTKVEPVDDGTINLARMSTTTAPSVTLKPKKATKRAEPADKNAPVSSEPARKRLRKSKITAISQPVPTRQAAPASNDGASAVSQPEIAELSSTTLQMHISLRRTPSLAKRRESYKGNKHPPRTVAYVQEHLQALGTVHWDVAGFECMELSALPWLAGIAEKPHASDGSYGDEPCKASNSSASARGPGVYDMIYAPDVPDQDIVDEEDVRIRLYAHGPLPASFLDALGRAVSIRRDGEHTDTVDTCMAEPCETVGIAGA